MITIVGHTGFVGSTLMRTLPAAGYDVAGFNSATIGNMPAGARLAIVCAPSAVKWLANQNAAADLEAVKKLVDHVNRSKPQAILHISTIDVYGQAQMSSRPDESVVPVPDCHYGANRLWAESAWVADSVKVVRLPGLYGPGLKKNIIFDMMNNKNLAAINTNSTYQWYGVEALTELVDSVIVGSAPDVANIAPAPLYTPKLIYDVFPHLKNIGYAAEIETLYDVRSLYSFSSVARSESESVAQIYNFVHGRNPKWTA